MRAQRLQRPLAHGEHVGLRARRPRRPASWATTRPGAARGRRRGRPGRRPPRRRGSRAAPCAAPGCSACASQSCISRRVSASSARERLVEAQHRLARRAACAGRRRAGACRRTARAGGRARSPPGRRPRRAGARARAPRRATPRPGAAASAALSIARQPRQQAVALGHEHGGVGARRVPASGACSPHTSSSSVVLPQPLGPTTATISPAPTSRSRRRARAPRRTRGSRPPGLTVPPASNVSRLLRRSLELVVIAPSAGITPQVRRVSAGFAGRYLSRPPPAPLLVCDGC